MLKTKGNANALVEISILLSLPSCLIAFSPECVNCNGGCQVTVVSGSKLNLVLAAPAIFVQFLSPFWAFFGMRKVLIRLTHMANNLQLATNIYKLSLYFPAIGVWIRKMRKLYCIGPVPMRWKMFCHDDYIKIIELKHDSKKYDQTTIYLEKYKQNHSKMFSNNDLKALRSSQSLTLKPS